jgi:hypothetical protein
MTASKIIGYFDPTDVRGGLWRLIALSLISMTLARHFINPNPVEFSLDTASSLDYWSMILMSALLIAIDAVLIVLLSWSHLRDWKDALGVALLVGGTHVVFPMSTFAITAACSIANETFGFNPIFSEGIKSGIFFLALAFVASHLREVHGAVREGDPEYIEPQAPVLSWRGVKEVFPAVFAVSIDALMVGPAKISFMSRYTPTQFWMAFVYIGFLVFALVMISGFLVLALKVFVRNHEIISEEVHGLDWVGSLLLVGVFIHFTVFAGVYVLYTFTAMKWLLETQTIWGVTVVVFSFYLAFGRVEEIRAASRERAGIKD